MKILVIKNTSPKQVLVTLHTDKLVREVATLIGKKKYSKAISTILEEGRFEREIKNVDIEKVRADLILTEEET